MYIYYENKKFKNHIIYSFETLLRCVLKDKLYFEWVTKNTIYKPGIYYGKSCPKDFKGIVICEGFLFSEKYLKAESLPNLDVSLIDNLPSLYNSFNNSNCTNNTNYIINDIIQGTFFFVTGYEEVVNSGFERDLHSRYFAKNRFLYRFCEYKRAIVNEYAEYLYKYIIRFGLKVEKIEERAYSLITHDVDIPFVTNKIIRQINKLFINKRTQLFNIMHPGIKLIIDTEKEYKINSSWYFMSGGNHEPYDIKYNLASNKILSLINKLNELNNEIGWHYSYDAAYDEDKFLYEANRFKEVLNKTSTFGRNHFLRYNIPESWRYYNECELLYDSTLGSAEHEGYIYGICTPFQLFDIIEGKNLGIWEFPLIVMDATLLSKDYRKLNFESAYDIIKFYVNDVKRHNGVFTSIWHNSKLCDLRFQLDKKLYKEAMKYISKNLDCLTGNKIIDCYKYNVVHK